MAVTQEQNSILTHATGGEFLGSNIDPNSPDQGSYWRVAKADGGYDYYRVMPNGYDVALTSQQDTEIAVKMPAGTLGGAQGIEIPNFTPPTTGGGTDTSALTKSISDLEATRNAVISQFEPLYAKYLADLNTNTTEAKNALNKDYWRNAESNDKSYGEGIQNIQRGYAARGIGDSSYKENALQGLQGDFGRIYGDLTSQKDKGIADYDKQYGEKLASANAMKNNFYNPNRPQYTDVSQVASAGATLNSQLDTAKAQLANANVASTTLNNPAASDRLFQEYITGQADNGVSMADAQKGVASKGLTDPSYDAYLSYIYGAKSGDPYKFLNPQSAKYLY